MQLISVSLVVSFHLSRFMGGSRLALELIWCPTPQIAPPENGIQEFVEQDCALSKEIH